MMKPANVQAFVRYGDTAYRNEIPFRALTGRTIFNYYRSAGHLVIADRRTGYSLTLRQEDIQENPAAIRLLDRLITDWRV
jgi:hypothetical protein